MASEWTLAMFAILSAFLLLWFSPNLGDLPIPGRRRQVKESFGGGSVNPTVAIIIALALMFVIGAGIWNMESMQNASANGP